MKIDESISELLEKFEEIKKQGYIKSTRNGTTGIGKTFEDLIGKKEDQDYKPDFKGIEIKTKNIYSKSYTTLFNLTPKGKIEYEIKRIQKVYGYRDRIIKECNVLNNSVYSNVDTLIGNKYNFRLKVDRKENKIYLIIKDKNHNFLEKKVFWNFEELENRLLHKMYYLALIKAWRTTRNGEVYYKYTDIKIYRLKSFEKFVDLVESGVIKITFRIDVFRSGPRYKETHDRGTSFQIKESDILELYDCISL